MARDFVRSFPLGLLVLLSVFSPRANATLGESVDTIEADRTVYSAMKRGTRSADHYTVHSIDSGGTVIREYVSPSGTVFGVAWTGYSHPELAHLLGSYYAEYQTADRETERKLGSRRRAVTGAHVVVEKWGHMRNLQGRAYDPSLIPSGVNANEIQ